MKSFSSKIGTEKCPPFPFLFNIMLKILATAIRQLREIKEVHIGKEEVKELLFADYMIVYISGPLNSTGEL